jgi:hypothetical protein
VLTLGWKASAEQLDPKRLLDYAVLAEELGYDSIAISDHFHPWRNTGGHAPFAFAWLGAAAAKTSRARLGTSVVTPSFRYHPAIVAQAMATIALLAPGRVFLGLGSGESMNETPLTTTDWPEPGERLRRLRDDRRVVAEGGRDHARSEARARRLGRRRAEPRESERRVAARIAPWMEVVAYGNAVEAKLLREHGVVEEPLRVELLRGRFPAER